MKIYGLIYCFINLLDGKMYIGKTTALGNMTRFFKGKYIGSSPSHTPYMRSRLKHGDENFYPIVLEFIEGDKHDLNASERKWIASIRKERGTEMVYNLTDGGDGRSNFNWTSEEKQKISDGMYERVKNDPFYGEKRRKTTTEFWSDPDRKQQRSSAISSGNTLEVSLAKSKSKRRLTQEDYKFISPTGEVHQFPCLSIFCREHKLNVTCMSRVHGGHVSHFQGWKKFTSLQTQSDI
jgi:group I intron endonuclease